MSFQKLLESDFYSLNRSRSGYISLQEIQSAVYAFGLPREAAKEFLHYCDLDKDGKISKAEFEAAVKRRKARRISLEDTKNMYTQMGASGNGRLDFTCFVRHMMPLNKGWSESQMKTLFQKYDKRKKGYLTKEEFDALVRESS
ncbi:16 kDa calcium-binding protein [Clonorchis sinensis]|uniref:16 kDa calcium-binding protein n=2 Tax=Clonorchis sinensis TaxID=79923 RepID=A0A8T1M2E5_CLOSI|nr:16 kDa calcium-binding protein [Clonorchis sinensis]GAA53193.1 calcium-dependent protein kinase 17 [Clonorchis sinensis]